MKNYSATDMNSDHPDQNPSETSLLEEFVFRFFTHYGAILERESDGWNVVLPRDLSQELEAPDYITIRNSSETKSVSKDTDVYTIRYGSPLLEKIIDVLCRKIQVVSCTLHFDYIKSQGFENLIQEQFSFINSSGLIENRAPIQTDYMVLNFWYQALSDEQKEGIISITINLDTGAMISQLTDTLVGLHREFQPEYDSIKMSPSRITPLIPKIQTSLQSAIQTEIISFRESMNRRFRRDVGHLSEYYAGLREEMEKSLERPGLSEQLIQERREKIAMLPDEFSRKKDDLFKKYSIQISAKPCAAMLIKTPAVKLIYRASVGKKSRNVPLYYNPITKSLDPIVCQSCGADVYKILFCKNLHLTCHACGHNCSMC